MSVLALRPLLIGSLHLPEFGPLRAQSVAEIEDYTLANAAAFAEGGMTALMIQDQTRGPGAASAETIALTAALVRLVRARFPSLELGVIVQAHDAVAPLAIAHAAGASFVRLKVFVGQSMTAEGPREGLAGAARDYRASLGRPDLAILADVHDRTSFPLGAVPPERAALWAQAGGADALILTGASFADSLARIRAARQAGVTRPVLVGGSVDEANVAEALAAADGAIVSTSLMRDGAKRGDRLRWDAGKVRRLMELAVRRVRAGAGG